MDRALKILLVEGHKADRVAIRRMLRKVYKKIEIDEVPDRAAGMEALGKTRYDCAIIDYLLPDGDGAAFVKEAGLHIHRPPPFVVLTGKGDRDTDLKVMEAGAAEYLEKENLDHVYLDRAVRYAVQNHLLVRQLKESNEKLQELDELKTEFLSTASHELRTPLTIIREFISLVRDGITGAITEEQQECLDSALTNCDRLGNILNDLLDLQRIESGRARLARKKESLADIIRVCCRDFQPQCQGGGQRLDVTMDDSLPEILCDRAKIEQVLVNLIGNALKFTDPGQAIRVSASSDSGQVKIRVEDDGPGIRAEDMDKIFDRFTQVNRHAGPGTRGTGLGLAICKKIMELHQGEISVKSKVGQGSCFTIALSVHSEERELEAFIHDRAEASGGRGRSWLLFFLKAGVDGFSSSEEMALLHQAQVLMQGRMDREKDGILPMKEARMLAVMLSSGEEGSWSLMKEMTADLTARMDDKVRFYFAVQPITKREDHQYAMNPRDLEFKPLSREEDKVLQPAHRGRD